MKKFILCGLLALSFFTPPVGAKAEDIDNSDRLRILKVFEERTAKIEQERIALELEKKQREEQERIALELEKRKKEEQKRILAEKKEQTSSLYLYNNSDSVEEMKRKLGIYLKGTPMESCCDSMVEFGLNSSIHPYVLAGIATTESTIGKAIPKNSFNPYGLTDGKGGYKKFDSFISAVEYEASYLKKYYVDVGLTTLAEVNKKYCPPNNQWSISIENFCNKINKL